MKTYLYSGQTLGLPGEAARTRPKGNSKRAGAGAGCTGGGAGVLGGGAGGADRYVSMFDLSSKAFRPGKPMHDRLFSCLGGKAGGEGNGEAGRGASVDVDMIVCWWGDEIEGRDTEKGEGERESGGVDRGVDETTTGTGQAGDEKIAVADDGHSLGAKAGHGVDQGGEGARGGTDTGDSVMRKGQQQQQQRLQQQQQRKDRRCCYCRDITFPPGFSGAEKVQLKPEVRFFREACCPDLDLVGQGLVAPSSSRDQKRVSDRCKNKPLHGAGERGKAGYPGTPSGFNTQEEAGAAGRESGIIANARFRERTSNSTLTSDGDSKMRNGGEHTKVETESGTPAEGKTFSDPLNPTNTTTAAAAATAGGERGRDGERAMVSQQESNKAKCSLMLDLFEWLGAVSCGLEAQLRRYPSPPEPFLSEFETPQHLQYRPPRGVGSAGSGMVVGGSAGRTVCRARLRGLVPPPAIRTFIEAAGAVASGICSSTQGEIFLLLASRRAPVTEGSAYGVDRAADTNRVDSESASSGW